MERETLLTILLLLFGGLATQPFAPLPSCACADDAAESVERRAWIRLWLPVMPMLIVAAWLCGWALRQPDPVRGQIDRALLIVSSMPFAVIAVRAVLRAAWSLVRDSREIPIRTIGLLYPRIVFSPFLAQTLDAEQIRAAREHEEAHTRHRDPLRIWLAQIAADLQWPWPGARERFDAWLEALECARDAEARRHGVSGADLAAAVLAAAKQCSPARQAPRARTVQAGLVGDVRALRARITRLLSPLPEVAGVRARIGLADPVILAVVAVMLALAGALGAAYGNAVLQPFFAWTWTV
ncbi:MAG TPA: hypothetical protein VF428_12885 [Casimicrobiaceae bacterium]